MTTENYVSLEAAAEYFGVSTKTLRRGISEKKIPAMRVGRQIRLKIGEVEESMKLMGSAAPQSSRPTAGHFKSLFKGPKSAPWVHFHAYK